jgi:hypothetical protein
MSETFTTFVTDAPTRTLDGTELVPLVVSDTEQNTLANIAEYINAPPSQNLSYPGPYTLGTSTGIYYVTMSGDGTFSAYLPTSASMTNRTLTFVTVNNVDEGGLNLWPNGSDQIQNGGGGSAYFITGNGNNSVSILSDGVGNWWITSQYS